MFELIRSNKRRSVLLVAGFVVFVALVGAAIGAVVGNGIVFTLVALVLSGVIAFTSYWRADKIAWRSAGRGPLRRRSTSACTTSSKGCASPAGCRNRASTSSTTRPRTRSPRAATRTTRRSP
jgi:fatty acid desaturase